ncbi:RNA polymerase sigma factor [Oligosphaera ethanolica]|uniref:RNA polymerase sigma-70 factor (ECF subfamily) n=1 Tax=Oligosphaera ethanolica TaxID=760260 RepID=A0AAE3VH81_9BACT|nr:RNA polymerase sigma factor [Oligosphaera ethanolica]MDD4538901.1 RNA polymerase sigma factor [Lentisphaeria bacterium]MDQ0290447.1 RNA polymerase sigma-70 factor (ECF subfamily) [Oligosphaera ethanolica]NLE55687.1 RNA polymerase sigma factor [Lentisphaerota bacterium]HQL09722.1 RNA polymerase sigma factor [Lentisphaeria bacterium]
MSSKELTNLSIYEVQASARGSQYGEATDWKLVKWMCDGDTVAFEEIFARYETRLVAYASRYVSSLDLAKDVCQEVFLKLIARPPSKLIYDNLGPWLFRVTRNLAIDKRRRRKFEITGDESEMPEARDEVNPLQTLTRHNDAAVIRDLVNRLPDDLREVVELRIDGGVSFKDIAVILDIPQGTALWRMHRAVEVLRQQWRNYEPQV